MLALDRALPLYEEGPNGHPINKIVTWINKQKGIHYRPHRQNPKKFVVVKIYRTAIPGLSEEETRSILADFLAGMGLIPEKGIIKGSVKWVAIIDKAKFEEKIGKKVTGKGKVTKSTLKKSLTKAKKKTSTTQKAKKKIVQKTKGWQAGKYTLGGSEGSEVKAKAGKYTLGGSGGSEVKAKAGKYTTTFPGKKTQKQAIGNRFGDLELEHLASLVGELREARLPRDVRAGLEETVTSAIQMIGVARDVHDRARQGQTLRHDYSGALAQAREALATLQSGVSKLG